MSTTVLCPGCGDGTDAEAAACAACGAPPLLVDRYRLEATVGRGASGVTYRATDTRDGSTVAIKELALRHAAADVVERAEREARVLGELHHDRIPALVDHFTTGVGKQRAFYLVQCFVDGPTLAAEMARRRYTEDEVLGILDAVLEVLEYLHDLRPPVVHRDLKPGNIMRRAADGALMLVDFGTVREVLEDPRLGGSTVSGTYGYMAPEQFRGHAEPRTDLYAVGVLGVVLLSRRDPLDLVGADHSLDWKGAVYAADGTKALLERLLAPDLVMRPASAASARATIAALRRGDAAPAPRPPPLAPPTLPVPVAEPPPPAPIITRALRRRVGARSRPLAVALAVLGGYWGLHNWYLPDRKVRAVLSLMFFWTFIPLLLSLVDAWSMVRGSQADFDARFNPALMVASGQAPDPAAAIERLHALHLQGALSKEEFEREKRRVLDDHAPGPSSLVDPEAVGQLLGRLGLGSDRLLRQLAKKARKGGVAARVAREVLAELEGPRRRKPPDEGG